MRVEYLAIAATALFAVTGCAQSAGAESQAVVSDTPDAGSTIGVSTPYPTSTPWPRFGPPPVTADSITATVPAAPQSQSNPGEPVVATVYAGEEVIGTGGFEMKTSPVPQPVRTPTPLNSSGTFQPYLPLNYILPDDWIAVIGDDEIVLVQGAGEARVTVRERLVDRAGFRSIKEIAEVIEPSEFIDWTERSASDARAVSKKVYSFSYSGSRLGDPYLATVIWHLWGELLVEITAETDAETWSESSKLRNSVSLLLEQLSPQGETSGRTAVEVQNLLRVRFNQRASNIFDQARSGSPATELACSQVFFNLLSEPVYVGAGIWQVYAVGDQGAQVWQIFEPSLSIVPADHNTSSC